MQKLLSFVKKHLAVILIAIVMLLIGSSFGPSQEQVEDKDGRISTLQKEIDGYKETESEHLTAIEKLEKENNNYRDAETAVKKKEEELKKKEELAEAAAKKEEEAVAKKKEEELAAKKKAEEEEAQRVASEKAMAEKAQASESASKSTSGSSNSNEASTSPSDSTSGQTIFANCTELRKVHPAGVPKGHPAYQGKMDRDKDDYACEN